MIDLKAAIETLVGLGKQTLEPKPAATVQVPGDWKPGDPRILVGATGQELAPLPRRVPSIYRTTTLAGLVGFVKNCVVPEDVMIGIDNPTNVTVYGRKLLDHWNERDALAFAEVRPRFTAFGKYMPVEDMVIALQACFESGVAGSHDTTALLHLISSVRGENVRSAEDNGATQLVAARVGVALREGVAITNPYRLAPYRTFAEISQPIGPFVVRAKQTPGLPEFALFEADGGAWENEAMANIEAKLTTLLGDVKVPILR